MKPRLYLETTIPSYLTSRPSRDLVIAGHQQITREWWEERRYAFEICISQLVIDEAVTPEVGILASESLASGTFPRKAGPANLELRAYRECLLDQGRLKCLQAPGLGVSGHLYA